MTQDDKKYLDELFCKGCENRLNGSEYELCEKCIHNKQDIKRCPDDYNLSTKTILVPVKVSYHQATDTFVSFTPPTLDQVEAAFKADKTSEVETALRNLLNYVVSGRRYDTINPYFVGEVKEAFKALGLNHLRHKEEK